MSTRKKIIDNSEYQIDKAIDLLQNDLISKFLTKYVETLPDLEVGTEGYFVQVDNDGFNRDTTKGKVTKSKLDPKADEKRWFDYDMIVDDWAMLKRYNPEGHFYFLTEKEYNKFVDQYDALIAL